MKDYQEEIRRAADEAGVDLEVSNRYRLPELHDFFTRAARLAATEHAIVPVRALAAAIYSTGITVSYHLPMRRPDVAQGSKQLVPELKKAVLEQPQSGVKLITIQGACSEAYGPVTEFDFKIANKKLKGSDSEINRVIRSTPLFYNDPEKMREKMRSVTTLERITDPTSGRQRIIMKDYL
jgi:hypothetical protein